MTPPRFLENADYRDSCRFIVEGHERLARGESSLPKTEEEHDRMTAAWSDLDPAEKARVKGLSADLHMLRENEVVLKLDHAERSVEHLGKRLAEAVQNKKWDDVLVLLRYGPTFLTRDRIALLRGVAWQNLGHDDIALLFFDYAGKLKPENARAQVLELHTLLKLGRFQEAQQRSAEYARPELQPLDWSFSAAG